jgi:hypothetical protein
MRSILALGAVALGALAGGPGARQPLARGPAWQRWAGAAMLAYGWGYPHFLEAPLAGLPLRRAGRARPVPRFAASSRMACAVPRATAPGARERGRFGPRARHGGCCSWTT